jgi:threonine dehydrogenase-like Zn-dependent dehydrogenase
MRAPGQATVLGVGAVGLVATAAAAAYVGDQVSKRLPRYRQQSELYAEVCMTIAII